MSKVVTYFNDVYKELVEKTSWPSWSELFSSARVVMIASAIIAILVALMDIFFENVLQGIYSIL